MRYILFWTISVWTNTQGSECQKNRQVTVQVSSYHKSLCLCLYQKCMHHFIFKIFIWSSEDQVRVAFGSIPICSVVEPLKLLFPTAIRPHCLHRDKYINRSRTGQWQHEHAEDPRCHSAEQGKWPVSFTTLALTIAWLCVFLTAVWSTC